MSPKRFGFCTLWILMAMLAGCAPPGWSTATVEPRVVLDEPLPVATREITPDRILFGLETDTPRPTRTNTPTPKPVSPTPLDFKSRTPWPTPVPPYPMPVPTMGPSPTMRPYALWHPPTPTPRPTVTPTTTPPSGLRAWPKPTWTPLAPRAELARSFLARYADIAPERIWLERWSDVADPDTGEMIWVGRFEAAGGERNEHVYVDADGVVGLVPDRGQEVLATASQETGVATEELMLLEGRHMLYPYSHQYLYYADLVGPERWFGTVALDWRGHRVDVRDVDAAEKAARERACPKMHDGLCAALGESARDSYDVVVWAAEGADRERLEKRVLREDPDALIIRGWIHASLTREQLFDLSVLDDVGTMDLDPEAPYLRDAEPLSPLDRNLRFEFSEQNGAITLHLWTTPDYGCCNYELRAEMTRPLDQQLRVEVKGVYKPMECLTALGPAEASLNLGEISGRWRLNVAYPPLDLNDEYILDVTPERILLEQHQVTFTWATREAWWWTTE